MPALIAQATMAATMSDESRLGAMDPYGVRAMRYVRDHCPSRYAAIEDPVSFFSALGDQLRDEVLALEPTLAGAGPAGETWDAALGRRNMARLMAEDQVFSELYQAMPPEEVPEESEDWEPLMPDMSDLDRMEDDQVEDELP